MMMMAKKKKNRVKKMKLSVLLDAAYQNLKLMPKWVNTGKYTFVFSIQICEHWNKQVQNDVILEVSP